MMAPRKSVSASGWVVDEDEIVDSASFSFSNVGRWKKARFAPYSHSFSLAIIIPRLSLGSCLQRPWPNAPRVFVLQSANCCSALRAATAPHMYTHAWRRPSQTVRKSESSA